MYVYFILILFIIFLIGILADLYQSVHCCEAKHDYCVRSALLLICAVSLFVGPMIFGLEYEDAYIHSAAARYLSLDPGKGTDGFFIKLCVVGSLLRCSIEVTYGTQLIGFSSLLFPWSLWFPEATHVASIVSAAASALTLQLYWSFVRKMRCGPRVTCVGLVLLLSAPGYYFIGTSAFAEPVYTLYFSALTFYGIELLFEDDKVRPSAVRWIILISGSFLLVATKREGVLLVCLLFLIGLLSAMSSFSKKQRVPARVFIFVGLCSVAIALSFLLVNIWEGATRHAQDIHAAAFSLNYLAKLFPKFASAATNPEYFGLLGIGSVLAATVVLVNYHRQGILLVVIIAAYTLLYSAHARHKGFIDGSPVEPSEMVRYVFTLVPIAAALCTFGFAEALSNKNRRRSSRHPRVGIGLTIIIASTFIAYGIYQSISLKRRASYDEQQRLEDKAEYVDQKNESRLILVTPFSASFYAVFPLDTFIIDRTFSSIRAVRKLYAP